MTISKTLEILKELEKLKQKGGKHFSQISKLFGLEATTHNIEEAEKLLKELKEKQ
jgi:predicted CopG family antitoxin